MAHVFYTTMIYRESLSLIEREIRFTDPPTQHQPAQSSYQPILPPTNLPTIPPTIDEKVEWFETYKVT